MAYNYQYPRMLVTVDAVVFMSNGSSLEKILLIKRGNDPYKDHFALPGGFPEMNELLLDAAKRELFEETGLSNVNLYQLGAYDAIDRDPRDRNISVAFYGVTQVNNSNLMAGDDASEAKWFELNKLPPLAFDHKMIIEDAINRLNK